MNLSDLSLNQRHVLALFDARDQIAVSDVRHQLGLGRPTAKQVLMRLAELGLVERRGRNKGSFYTRPAGDQVQDEFGNALVTVYQGKTGFKRLFSQMQGQLGAGDEYWSFAFRHQYYDAELTGILLNFHHEITGKGVEDKTIVHTSVKDVVCQTYRNVPDLLIRHSSQEVPLGTLILKDRVVNLVWGEKPLAVVMHSEVLIKHYADFFESIWQTAEPAR